MKIVPASYKIDDMPDGEEALAKIERLGRIAYKSEDKIDSGVRQRVFELGVEEPTIVWAREPSSHRFVRMILQAERHARLVMMTKTLMDSRGLDAFAATGIEYKKAQGEYCEELVANIVAYMRENPAHESVIEHCSATVVFTSNRGFTHEIVRHRLASFTQESTRYCDYNKGKFDGEISVIERTYWGKLSEMTSMSVTQYEHLIEADKVWREALEHVEAAYKRLRELGIPPEIARDVLPQALKADIGVTANFREWRHIFALRDSPRAHPDMRQLMTLLHEEFRRRIPIIFD